MKYNFKLSLAAICAILSISTFMSIAVASFSNVEAIPVAFPAASTLSVYMQTPSGISAIASTTTGSLATGTPFFIQVAALDGSGGMTVPSSEFSTTTATSSIGQLTLTWNAVTGAQSYDVFFATSSGAESSFFTSTSSSYTFATSTGASTTTEVSTSTAFVNKLSASGNSYFLGGSFSIGSSTPIGTFQVSSASTTASTTIEFGSPSIQKATCIEVNRTNGSTSYLTILPGANTVTVSTSSCTTLSGF